MQLRFIDRTNTNIDRLVQIAWRSGGSHEGEYLRIPSREDKEIYQLINDEEESEPEGEVVGSEPLGTRPSPIDLSKFSVPMSPSEDDSSIGAAPEHLVVAVALELVYTLQECSHTRS